jgi:WD40 repeat protein
MHRAFDVKSHSNAVMDVAFSSDDLQLASASGDQRVHITDVLTSKTKFVLSGHFSSVKQVRFQPGNDNVLATSSRDGTVQLWDLRCRGREGPLVVISPDGTTQELAERVPHLDTYNSIAEAHLDLKMPLTPNPQDAKSRYV